MVKRIVDNKLKGAYGETDLSTGTIRINKKRHKSKRAQRINKNKDGTEKMIDTMVHENLHLAHPKMHERTVRKETKRKLAKMTPKQKKKVYNQFKFDSARKKHFGI